jgi:CheY-like chemotaxis protein
MQPALDDVSPVHAVSCLPSEPRPGRACAAPTDETTKASATADAITAATPIFRILRASIYVPRWPRIAASEQREATPRRLQSTCHTRGRTTNDHGTARRRSGKAIVMTHWHLEADPRAIPIRWSGRRRCLPMHRRVDDLAGILLAEVSALRSEKRLPESHQICPAAWCTPSLRGPSHTAVTLRRETARILVVDDDLVSVAVLRDVLGSSGHTVLTVDDVANVWMSIERDRPDLLVLDVATAGTDARRVLRGLIASDTTIAMIVVTATGDDDACRPFLQAGAFACVRKPFDVKDLSEAVAGALVYRRLARREVGAAIATADEVETLLRRLVFHSGTSACARARPPYEIFAGIVGVPARLRQALEDMKAELFVLRRREHDAVPFSASMLIAPGDRPMNHADDPDWRWQRVHPDDRDTVSARRPLLERDGSLAHEYRARRDDGSYVWLREYLRLVVDRHGKPLATVGLWLDITQERLRARGSDGLRRHAYSASSVEG